MTDAPLTADRVHVLVHELRARADIQPARIELGIAQRAALEAEVRDASGLADIGPMTQYNGLEIIKSNKHDHVRLLPADEVKDSTEAHLSPVPPGAVSTAVEATTSAV